MPLADPYIITNPKLTIGGVDFKCAARSIDLSPDTVQVNVGGYCSPGATRPGTVTWNFTVELMLGHNDGTNDGTWEELVALNDNTAQTIIIAPTDAAVGATNPWATFTGYIDHPPFMLSENEQTEASTFNLELVATTAPVFSTV